MLRRIGWNALGFLVAWPMLAGAGTTSRNADPPEPIAVHADRWSARDGLTLSITVPGDRDGTTTLSNQSCCGVHDAHAFVRDVRVSGSGRPLAVEDTPAGWRIHHAPGAMLKVTYRLPPSGPLLIRTGTPGQYRPLVDANTYHLLGTTALLLPVGRAGSDPVTLEFDATKVASHGRFVSSFGEGASLHAIRTTRADVVSALFLGGAIALRVRKGGSGNVAVAYSAMRPSVRIDALTQDALAIVDTERRFFDESQPWYLVSVRGAERRGSNIYLGGGTGHTNAFAMFVADDIDASNAENRDQFRWVIAHEYFHQWNGRQLRVASLPGSDDDDASAYWFSEGVTDFYATRMLARAGLQSPAASLDTLNRKLLRYATNGKRGISAREAGPLFWTDADAEQIPYLRGYLAAWFVELGAARRNDERAGLDAAMTSLVARAKSDADFRVDNAFLARYLGQRLSKEDAETLRRFVIDGGEAPFDSNSFRPCLMGSNESISGKPVLQFAFASPDTTCFRH
jgi:predicted metalloprotease with PDZ domain